MESASSEVRRVTSMIRTRPARSVTNSRPSGANAIDHGISRLVTTGSTTNRTPSVVVNTSPGGVFGDGAAAAGAAGVSDGQALVSATWTASMNARTTMPNGMIAILRRLHCLGFALGDVDPSQQGAAAAGAAGVSDGQALVSATWTASMNARTTMPNGMIAILRRLHCLGFALGDVDPSQQGAAGNEEDNYRQDRRPARTEHRY